MADMDQYRGADGNVNWEALRKAEVAEGSLCRSCGANLFPHRGYPSDCLSCQQMFNRSCDVWHDKLLRCPKCRHTWPAWYEWHHGENYTILEDDDGAGHPIVCEECDYEFKIETLVTRSFKSPALVGQ